jgi:hypothetical protein
MRLTTESGEEFHAHFYHHSVGKRRRRPHLRTEVRLHPGPCTLDANKHCTHEAVHAMATQHSRLDGFDKKVGRVVALDRALKASEAFPRELRAQLWASYQNQAKMPRSRAAILRITGHGLSGLSGPVC